MTRKDPEDSVGEVPQSVHTVIVLLYTAEGLVLMPWHPAKSNVNVEWRMNFLHLRKTVFWLVRCSTIAYHNIQFLNRIKPKELVVVAFTHSLHRMQYIVVFP